jgi:hypothetical protein
MCGHRHVEHACTLTKVVLDGTTCIRCMFYKTNPPTPSAVSEIQIGPQKAGISIGHCVLTRTVKWDAQFARFQLLFERAQNGNICRRSIRIPNHHVASELLGDANVMLFMPLR